MTERAARDERELSEGAGLTEQWVGLLLAPTAFFLHLQVAYVLVPWACEHRGDVWLHVAGVASVVLAALGMLVAWRAWRRAGGEPPSDDAPPPLSRARLLAVMGFAMSAVFVLLLLAQWVAGFFISPCQ